MEITVDTIKVTQLGMAGCTQGGLGDTTRQGNRARGPASALGCLGIVGSQWQKHPPAMWTAGRGRSSKARLFWGIPTLLPTCKRVPKPLQRAGPASSPPALHPHKDTPGPGRKGLVLLATRVTAGERGRPRATSLHRQPLCCQLSRCPVSPRSPQLWATRADSTSAPRRHCSNPALRPR